MRKMLAVTVVALLAFAGQAAADDGAGFTLPFCAAPPSGPTAPFLDDCTLASLITLASVITGVALYADHGDSSKSG